MPKQTERLEVFFALLRGSNVGGKNKLPMKALAAIFHRHGRRAARTCIRSGNVVLPASAHTRHGLAVTVSRQIESSFRHRPPMVLRFLPQMQEIVRNNPVRRPDVDEKTLHVVLPAETPSAQNVARLDPDRSAGDKFTVRGQEIYLHLPDRAANSKLTNAYFDSTLNTISMARNWLPVTNLLGMMQSLAAIP